MMSPRPVTKSSSALALFLLLGISASFAAPGGFILVKATPSRAHRGDIVRVEIQIPDPAAIPAAGLQAILLKPKAGPAPLELSPISGRPGAYRTDIKLGPEAPEGLYAIQAWTGDRLKSARIGKTAFLLGKLITDYPIMSLVDQKDPGTDIQAYLTDFRRIGGNFLILHVLVDAERAYYPSKIARNDVAPGSPRDLVEGFLERSDRLGYACLLSASWDMTHNTDSATCMAEIRSLVAELYGLYGHHPSLAGFYSYQEGSGTYLIPYLREFCDFVKSLNPGLLTGCAPYVDDPLLAGYMGALPSLDVIIYQGMTMASFRPDNVKRYPLRRVRDFCSVGIGGKWAQDKIAITHTELFGYLENRLSPDYSTTSYDNIYPQILSAAAAAGSDGISFFTYQANIHTPIKKHPEVAAARKAVEDGLAAFAPIWDKISAAPDPIVFYLPYADWVVERYADYYLPAFDGFRTLGLPAGFLPFTPATNESVYPFYPYHPNEEVLARLLKEGTVLVLPNVSGFHDTDSAFIESFVKRGGIIVAFGPQIPLGNTYDRAKLFGGDQVEIKARREIAAGRSAGPRTRAGAAFKLDGRAYPSWKASTAEVAAVFEDGSAAALINRYGRGFAVALTLDALSASRLAPDFVRDILGRVLRGREAAPAVDILGLNENVDVAVRKNADGFGVAVINHNADPLEIGFRPLGEPDGAGTWTDLVSGRAVRTESRGGILTLPVPGRQFVGLEYYRLAGSR